MAATCSTCFWEWGCGRYWDRLKANRRHAAETQSVENGPAREPSPVATRVLPMAGATLGGALIFFFVTNFADWYLLNMYAKTWQGLLDCYVAAIPFFRAAPCWRTFWGPSCSSAATICWKVKSPSSLRPSAPDAGFRRGRTANRLADRQRD